MFHRARRGFTLVELLVVIGIIAVLIGILLPSLNKARQQAATAKCLSNLRSIGHAINLYAAEQNGFLVPGWVQEGGPDDDGSGGPGRSAYRLSPVSSRTPSAIATRRSSSCSGSAERSRT